MSLPNYTNNLREFGFGDDDFADGGSDRLVDAIVAWGDVDAIAQRVAAMRDAGADHVCIQVIRPDNDIPLAEWRELARAHIESLNDPRDHVLMHIESVASVSVISADPAASRKLYIDALGLPLERLDGEYFASEKIDGSKHFGVWPLTEAAQACFGTTEWPAGTTVPQVSIEFEVADHRCGAAQPCGTRGAWLRPPARVSHRAVGSDGRANTLTRGRHRRDLLRALDAPGELNADPIALREPFEEACPLQEMAIAEVLVSHSRSTGGTHSRRRLRIAEHRAHCACVLVEIARVHERAGFAVDDLIDDSADGAADDRPFFPHRFGDGQPEAFRKTLLYDHRGVALQGVDDGSRFVAIGHRHRRKVDATPDRFGQA